MTLTHPATPPWPRITIVTPSFNQGPYLEATIRSVLDQDYPNLEYIIIDGRSQDESVAIIQKYAASLAYWVSEPDQGQTHAINKGFARASGDIWAWLNSDDLYQPAALHTIARAFTANPAAVLVYGDANYIQPDGRPRPGRPSARPYDRHWLLTESNSIPQPAAFFRPAPFHAAGGLDDKLHYVMDWDLWLRLGQQGPAVFLPQQLATMRIYPEAKFQAGGRAMHAELRQVIERNGGRGLPNATRQKLAAEHLDKAITAFAQTDNTTGRDELTYTLSNAPAGLQPAPEIAGRIMRLFREGSHPAPITLAQTISPYLPAELRPQLLGLLYEALAHYHHNQGQPRTARRYAWQAAVHDKRQLTNKGLWSVALRSLL